MKLKILTLLLVCCVAAACTPSVPPVPTLSPDQIARAAAATIQALSTPTSIEADSAAPTSAPQSNSSSPTLAPEQELAPLPAAPGLAVYYTDEARRLVRWTSEDGSTPLTEQGGIDSLYVSSDGLWIAFVRSHDYRDFSLWVIESTGEGERELYSAEEFNALASDPYAAAVGPYQIAWAPGSHTLAFSTYPLYEGGGLLLNEDLWLADVAEGSVRQVLQPHQGGAFYYSPDGAQIALVTPTTVSLVDSSGGSRREAVLTYPQILTYSEYQYYVQPVWSPDSAFLRVVVPPEDPLAAPRQPTTLWEIPASGEPAFQLASLDVSFLASTLLSPDLSRVAYLQPPGDDPLYEHSSLHVAAIDGSEDVLYQNEVADLKNWSPDSTRFVFASGGFSNLYLGELGSAPAPLVDTPSAVDVLWAGPDRFVFTVLTPTGWELRLGQVSQPSTLIATLTGDPNTIRPALAVLSP